MDVDLVDATDVINADTLDTDNADNTDTLDANTWEALQAIGPNQGHTSVVPLSPPPQSELWPPTPPLNPPIPDDSGIDSPAQLTVDIFPSGSPGAKILDPLQEHAACQSQNVIDFPPSGFRSVHHVIGTLHFGLRHMDQHQQLLQNYFKFQRYEHHARDSLFC